MLRMNYLDRLEAESILISIEAVLRMRRGSITAQRHEHWQDRAAGPLPCHSEGVGLSNRGFDDNFGEGRSAA
jgi:hypothetical protein